MATPIWPNAENCSLAELETAIRATPQKRGQMRMMAIRSLIMGLSHDTVATAFNVSRDTITNWVKRFNGAGIDGLLEQPRSGRPRKITAEQTPHCRELIEHPEQAGQTHWTGKKFHG
jgi:transposase